MANYVVSDGNLSAVADAIRQKGGTSAPLAFPAGFVSAVEAIPTGGGSGGMSPSDVNFYDYDGTIVNSYTAAEFAALSAMPENPRHDGLTAQGWNWSFERAQAYVAKYGKLNVGQMYITDDGKTRIYIRLEEGRLAPYLGIAVNGSVDVDWGDGSAHDTVTGSSTSTVINTQHTYAGAGDYVIALTVTGSMGLIGSSSYGSQLLWKNSTTGNLNRVYQNAIQKVEIGSGVTSIGSQAFYYCYSLASITIPEGVTSIENQAFYSCYSLASITIPEGVTSIESQAFYTCSGIGFIKFARPTPPTVSSRNAWTNIPTDCIIYVPAGSLAAYTSATNYPSSSTYTYVEY